MKKSTVTLMLGLAILTMGANAKDIDLVCSLDAHYWGEDGNSPHSNKQVTATVSVLGGGKWIRVTNLPYHQHIDAGLGAGDSDSYFAPVNVNLAGQTYRSLRVKLFEVAVPANYGYHFEAFYQPGPELVVQRGWGKSAFRGSCIEKRG